MNKQRQREQVAHTAEKEFKDHMLTVEQGEGPVRMWYCGRPGTGIYSFRVIAAPGFLGVYGDVGDGMLMAYDRDLVKWLPGAVRSPEYLMSKMRKKQKEFNAVEAREMMQRMIDESHADEETDESGAEEKEQNSTEKMVEEILDNWDDDPPEHDGHCFFQAAFDAGMDTEMFDSVMDYCADDYWTLACLKKFLELLEKANTNKGEVNDV